MKFAYILFLLLLLFSSCWNFSKNQHQKEAPNRPNVLFILADDFGLQDMSFTGSAFYETPNLDRLALKSTVFTQGYAGSRVCSPSRATIMTGKFTARHGITNWIGERHGEDWRKMNRHDKLLPADYVHELSHQDITLAEAMKANGYKTFFAGKWHLGDEGSYPEDHGFDINKGGYLSGSPRGGYYAPYDNPKLDQGPDGENLSMRLANETIDFITNHKDSSFFAFLSFYAVHGPIQTTQEKWKKYRDKAETTGLSKKGFTMEKKLPIRIAQDNPVYAGLVETMDDAIGLVLDHLEKMELEKNTIIIFTSDNGGVASGDAYSTSNLPFRGGKGYHWEGGIREPFMIFVPNEKNIDGKCDYPATGADFYPTILDYAGLELLPGQHQDGISLRPVIEGSVDLPERSLYWHYPHYGNQGGDPSSIFRQGDWKLIYYYEEEMSELYNLKKDPYEKENVANVNPEIAGKMEEQLLQWLREVNAQFPVKDELFDAQKRATYDENILNNRLPFLEKQRLDYLSPDFDPKNNWWGSKRLKD